MAYSPESITCLLLAYIWLMFGEHSGSHMAYSPESITCLLLAYIWLMFGEHSGSPMAYSPESITCLHMAFDFESFHGLHLAFEHEYILTFILITISIGMINCIWTLISLILHYWEFTMWHLVSWEYDSECFISTSNYSDLILLTICISYIPWGFLVIWNYHWDVPLTNSSNVITLKPYNSPWKTYWE